MVSHKIDLATRNSIPNIKRKLISNKLLIWFACVNKFKYSFSQFLVCDIITLQIQFLNKLIVASYVKGYISLTHLYIQTLKNQFQVKLYP